MKGVCALFVLYNPEVSTIRENIKAALQASDAVCVVDNSPQRLGEDVLADIAGSHYYFCGGNVGVAKAYNYGLEYAGRAGCDWLLTMDQDSVFPSDFCAEARRYVSATDCSGIGILAPNTQMFSGLEVETGREVRDEEYVISSGSLTNVGACTSVGGFRDELFIDGVDIEICWRLRLNGFKVRTLRWVVMRHSLGNESREVTFFGRHLLSVTNESALRYYYIFRNYMWLVDAYRATLPAESRRLRASLRNMLVKMLFFEQDKVRKLRYIREGVGDYRSGRFGKYVAR